MTADVIKAARGWLGTPYMHQASVRDVGCDCLGLIRGIWREVRGDEPEIPPPYAPDWAEAGGAETLIEAARRHLVSVQVANIAPGDVMLFRWRAHLPAKHVGVLMPDTMMIHAQDGAGVAEVAFCGWWRRHLAAAFRFPEFRA
jgi:NlpC/P60 family putative phage cell wall peptidase